MISYYDAKLLGIDFEKIETCRKQLAHHEKFNSDPTQWFEQVKGLLPMQIDEIGTDSDLDGIEIPNDLLVADEECIKAPSSTIIQIVNEAR